MDMNLSRIWELLMDREDWLAVVYGVTKSRAWLSDWTELTCLNLIFPIFEIGINDCKYLVEISWELNYIKHANCLSQCLVTSEYSSVNTFKIIIAFIAIIIIAFNSDDHYIYYCRQESLRRNGVAIMVNKRVWNAILGCNLKNDRMISVRFQGKPFNITVIQVYAPNSNAKEAEVERFYEDLQ